MVTGMEKQEEHITIKTVAIGNLPMLYEMLQHIGANENAFHNDAYGMPFDEFAPWLDSLEKHARGECLPAGYVPEHTYWLYVDDKPVGYGKIRERLTESSKAIGGNIGYAIDSRQRGKGYATKLLSLLIEEAERLGVKERLLTVEKVNPASKAVIEKCGGRLIDENELRWFFTI